MSDAIRFNPGDEVETAQRVRAQIRASAEEQGLLEYLEGDDFVPMKVPKATTADSIRRYGLCRPSGSRGSGCAGARWPMARQ